jgi:hypothetical protein
MLSSLGRTGRSSCDVREKWVWPLCCDCRWSAPHTKLAPTATAIILKPIPKPGIRLLVSELKYDAVLFRDENLPRRIVQHFPQSLRARFLEIRTEQEMQLVVRRMAHKADKIQQQLIRAPFITSLFWRP